jgi:hypothetical protein
MGTRNVTIVINKGKTVIAQYGQWDGYPSGQGETIREFLKTADIAKFREKLKDVRWINKAKRNEINEWFKSIGCADGWMNMEQAELYHKAYPLLTRDNGAKVLEMIYAMPEGEIAWIENNRAFVADGLFCEWAYVVDLDKEVLEVYEGFNKTPLEKGQRFRQYQPKDYDSIGEKYFPARCIKKFKFSELPDNEEDFCNLIEIETSDYKERMAEEAAEKETDEILASE